MSTLLRLTQAGFGYEGRTVIRDVDLSIESGCFLGIVGPNGGGKSTLFRGCLGLIPPIAGRVERGTKRLGYVPQREALDADFPLRVDEVVHMGAFGRISGWRRLPAEDRELAAHCLERVGLAEKTRARFASLSGGQRQRALIARALMVRPELLMLDEPTSGVDRGAQRRILELLLDLNRRERIAVLLVSHQLQMLRGAVDEVLWVEGGRVAHGDAATLLSPESLDRLYGAASVADSTGAAGSAEDSD